MKRDILIGIDARRGAGWQIFGEPRVRADGRFRFTYRFVRTTGVQRYRLRARVKAQAGYPYATATSKALTVRVRE